MLGARRLTGFGLRAFICFALLACLCATVFSMPARADTEQQCGGAGATDPKQPSDAPQAQRATLLFIPGPLRTPRPALAADLEQLPGFSVGLFSPTLGRYTPVQMMLDISQGARVASSLYKPATPPQPGLLVQDGVVGGRLTGWAPLVARADAVPGDVEPGLFGCALGDSKRVVEWIGTDGGSTLSAVAAADLDGRIQSIATVQERSLSAAIDDASNRADLVVAELPKGGVGYGIARALAAADPERMIVVVQSPPDPARTRLLTLAVRGVGDEGGITSATTRRAGLVAATDIAPTILERVGVTPPRSMQGQPIESASKLSAAELNEMNDRLALIAGRRAPLGKDVVILGGIVLLLLLLLGRFTGRFRETARLAQRVVGLAVLWLPLFLLLTALLRPSRAIEADIVVFGSLLLGFLTDRLIAWPRAPWLPALVVLIAHGFDFIVLNGQLTGESLLGSNPLYGARFFGVGNELEAVLCVSAVIGVGAAMCGREIAHPGRWFAGAGAALALYLGAGRIGADVGGVIFAAAAFGAAALYAARMKITVVRALLIAVVPIVGLILIGLLDAVSSGESHLTRTVFEAESPGELFKVVERRFRASYEGARNGGAWIGVLIALALLAWGWIKRERVFSRLTENGASAESMRPYRAGVVGGLAGTVIGALANDSGPAILIIGTIYLGMGVLYMRGRPIRDEGTARLPTIY